MLANFDNPRRSLALNNYRIYKTLAYLIYITLSNIYLENWIGIFSAAAIASAKNLEFGLVKIGDPMNDNRFELLLFWPPLTHISLLLPGFCSTL